MSTVTSLKFAVESSWDGSGVDQAKAAISSLKADIEAMSEGRITLQVQLDGVEETKAKLDEISRGHEAVIRATADTTEAKAKVDEISRDHEAVIRTTADTTEAKAKLDEASHSRDTNIRADADTAEASTKLDILTRLRKVRVLVETDTDGAEKNISNVGGASMAAKLGVLGLVGAINGIGPAAALVGGGLMTALGGGVIAAAIGINKAISNMSDEAHKAILTGIIAPIQGPLQDATNAIWTRLKDLTPQLAGVFASAAPLIMPFVDGITGAVKGMIPGITTALQSMLPLFQGLGDGLTTLGGSIGNMFAKMAPAAASLGQIARDFGTNFGQFLELWGGFVGETGPLAATTLQKMGEGINNFLAPALQGVKGFMENTSGGASILGSLFATLGSALQAILPALGIFQEALAGAIGPAIQALGPAIGQFAGAFLQALAPVLTTVAPIITDIATGLATVLGWIQPMLPVLAPLAAAIWLVNLAMDANPAVILGLAIAALVGGIVYLATKTQFFQNIWAGVKTAWDAVWNAIKTAFSAVLDFLSGKWSWFLALIPGIGPIIALAAHWKQIWDGIKLVAQLIWDWLKNTWSSIVNAFKVVWDIVSGSLRATWTATWNLVKNIANSIWTWMRNTWNSIISGFLTIWDNVSHAISASWNAVWNAIKLAALAVWNFLRDAWNTFLNGIKAVYDVASKILSDAWSAIWNGIKDVVKGIWDWIRGEWDGFWNGIKAAWDFWSGTISKVWSDFWNGIKDVAKAIWDEVKREFDTFTDGLSKAFHWIVDTARDVWDGMKKVFATPINFVFNAISDTVGKVVHALDFGHDPVKLADGGRADGQSSFGGMQQAMGGSRADNKLIAVSGGEYVVNANTMSRPGMLQHMDSINFGNQPIPEPTSASNNFAPAGPGNQSGTYAEGGEVKGPHGELSSDDAVKRAFGWAQSKAGQPYNADGWIDCSGLASGVYDNLLGRSPGREFTTVSDFEGLGFMKGSGGMFEIGVLPKAGDEGHMAMTLDGHNIESAGGGKNIQVDGGAWGADNSYFTDHYFLPGNLYQPMYFGKGWSGESNDKSIWGKITGAVKGAVNFGRTLMTDAFIHATDPIINAIPAPFPGTNSPPGDVIKEFVKKGRDEIVNFVRPKEQSSGGGGGISNAVPTAEHKKVIDDAIALAGGVNNQAVWESGYETLISRESGWNAGAVNDWDSNAQAGFPTKGLTQMRDDTFAAHAIPGHTDIFNPVDNIASDIGYIKSQYGDITSVQQANPGQEAHGYQDGTKNAEPGWAIVGEAGPEMVKFGGGEQVMSNPDTQAMLNNLQGIASQHAQGFQTALTAPIDEFGSDIGLGSITSGSGFVPTLIKQSIDYSQKLQGWQPPAGSLLGNAMGIHADTNGGGGLAEQDPNASQDPSAGVLDKPESAPQANAQAGVDAQAQAIKDGKLPQPTPAAAPMVGGDLHLHSQEKDPVKDWFDRLHLHSNGFDSLG